jgi:hypothetical protein
MDALYLGLTVVLAALSLGLVAVCDLLMGAQS